MISKQNCNYIKFKFLFRNLSILLILLLYSFHTAAQINLLGKPGYVLVPSAEWEKKPSLALNIGYLPIESTINTSEYFNYNGIYYGARIGITDYLEVSLNITYHIEKIRVGIGDRQMDARLRLKQESKLWPGIAVIVSLPIESNNLIAYNAVSMTKNFEVFGKTRLQLTGGYGLPYYFGIPYGKNDLGFYPKSDDENEYLSGFFGAISWKPVPWAGMMAEYDTRNVNAGLWVGYKDRIGLQYHLYGLKHSGGNFYFKVPLDFESLELRRFRKSTKKQGI